MWPGDGGIENNHNLLICRACSMMHASPSPTPELAAAGCAPRPEPGRICAVACTRALTKSPHLRRDACLNLRTIPNTPHRLETSESAFNGSVSCLAGPRMPVNMVYSFAVSKSDKGLRFKACQLKLAPLCRTVNRKPRTPGKRVEVR